MRSAACFRSPEGVVFMADSVPARSPSGTAPGRHWRKRFLETLTATSDIERAASAARVTVTRSYQTRRIDPDFARAWHAAIADSYLNLEIAVHRAGRRIASARPCGQSNGGFSVAMEARKCPGESDRRHGHRYRGTSGCHGTDSGAVERWHSDIR